MASSFPSNGPSAAENSLVVAPRLDNGENGSSSVENEMVNASLFEPLDTEQQEDAQADDGDDVLLLQDTRDRSLVADLHSHLNDSDIADVMLVGTDGLEVMAVRSILAMRSNFFRKLFFGNFSESSSPQVQLGYSSNVIKAVVEYSYTDEIKTAFENLTFEETARSMVGLVAAGNYFELSGLQLRAYKLSCLMMDEYPALACAVLDEVSINNETKELGRVALGIIRLRPESSLLPPDAYGLGVQSLGPAAMEQVMSDSEIQTSELSLFMCLKKWAEYNTPVQQQASNDTSSITTRTTTRRQEERREAARNMAHHIDFSKIAPSVLSTTVQSSGLVPTELLLKAYTKQALHAERKGIINGKMRCTLNEATSGSVMVQGAGLASVNGMYNSCNSPNDPLRYSRRGSMPGFGRGTYVLQTWVLQDDSKKWFLSFVQNNVASTTIDLYSSPVLSDTDPPPMQKWLSVSQGHEKIRRQVQNTFPARQHQQQHHTFESSSRHGDDGSVEGDPPPICIWLPNDSSSSSTSRGS